jgi:hypothetical protein
MSDLPIAFAAPLRSHRRRLRTWLAELLSPKADDEAIRRSREKLAEYDDRLLRDIGMTREDMLRRAPRSASHAPDWWVMMRAR